MPQGGVVPGVRRSCEKGRQNFLVFEKKSHTLKKKGHFLGKSIQTREKGFGIQEVRNTLGKSHKQ